MNGSTFMKTLALAALGSLLLVAVGRGTTRAEGSDLTVTLSKLDVAHGIGSEPVDQVDLILNFNNTEASESGNCESTSDSPIHGFVVGLQEGACEATAGAATVTVPSLRKIGKNKYKFEGITQEGATVDAILTMLVTPAGSCGKWHLKLDATPVDLSSIKNNPVATSIALSDASFGCLSATGRIDR